MAGRLSETEREEKGGEKTRAGSGSEEGEFDLIMQVDGPRPNFERVKSTGKVEGGGIAGEGDGEAVVEEKTMFQKYVSCFLSFSFFRS